MEVWVRNITKDNMVDFNNDYCLNLPMEPEKLTEFLGNDEWIIINSPVGEELTDIQKLNEIVNDFGVDNLEILSKTYLFSELEGKTIDDFTIVDFDAATTGWGSGYGVPCDDYWRGFVLFQEGLVQLPFPYTSEMEDWIQWEYLWTQAETEDWRHIYCNGNDYLVKEA